MRHGRSETNVSAEDCYVELRMITLGLMSAARRDTLRTACHGRSRNDKGSSFVTHDSIT